MQVENQYIIQCVLVDILLLEGCEWPDIIVVNKAGFSVSSNDAKICKVALSKVDSTSTGLFTYLLCEGLIAVF